MEKFGYVTQQMIRDFKSYDVSQAYAYNSPFDVKVFQFNCDWFKVINPLELVTVYDIRGYVHKFVAFTDDFQLFCERNECFTDTGNYSTTAETLYRYFSQDMQYIEEHTALSDSLDEWTILKQCINMGGHYGVDYKTYMTIPRFVKRTLTIVQDEQETTFTYLRRTNKGDKIFLK